MFDDTKYRKMVTYIINNQSTQYISYQIISEDIVNQCCRIFRNTARSINKWIHT